MTNIALVQGKFTRVETMEFDIFIITQNVYVIITFKSIIF